MCLGKFGKLPFFLFLFAILTAGLSLGTCGLEDYPFIYPVPQGNVTQTMNYRAEVRVPNNNSGNAAFSHFAIFYRIYVSNVLVASTTTDTFSAINSVLASNYNSVSGYIDSDTLVNTNMDTFFRNLSGQGAGQGVGYNYLALQNANIDNVLSSSVLNNTIIFDFPVSASAGQPTMTIGANVYTLMRSETNLNGTFTPRPNKDFVNNNDLWDPQYLSSQFNADVVDKSGIQLSDRHYTYAAMFIVAVGNDPNTYGYIYSTPSLIHVFLLPDP